MNARGKITLLMLFFATCGTAAIITTWFEARMEGNVKPAELYSVVNNQLQGLSEADFPRAYEYASSGIQQRFNLEQFSRMVREDYPGLMQVSHAEYGAVERHGPRATMQVYLIGQDGQVMPCLYLMVREGETWRIDGARLMHPWPATVKMGGTML